MSRSSQLVSFGLYTALPVIVLFAASRYFGFSGFFDYVVVPILILVALGAAVRFGIGRAFPGPIGAVFRAMPLSASFGIVVIVIYIAGALLAPVISPFGEFEVFKEINLLPGDDPRFILGTDQIGRDLLSRLIYGGRNTIFIALVTTMLAFLLGATFGFMAAVFGGWLDQLLSRIVDAMMAIPQLIFALLLITIFGQDTLIMILVIAVLDSTRVFRLARAVGVNIVVMDYIEAAKLRGESLSYLIFKEILPNATAPLLAEFGLRFCFVFLLIASLSFLGLGIQPPWADWGTMVRSLAQFINFAGFGYWLTATLPLMPAAAIALLTVAVNFVVDWMLHRYSGLKE